jgi:RNA polymerase sigma-70 factor (ECF subfamily)
VSDEFKTELLALLPRLRRYALARTGSIHCADDLLQATCERAWKCRGQLMPGTRMDSWTFKIMTNLHIDEIRAVSTRGIDAGPDALEQVPDDRWQRRIEGQLILGEVAHVMRELPEDMRDVLALVSIEGLSYREAAAVLDVPLGTVMSRLARARTELMNRLKLNQTTMDWATE